MTRPWSPPIRLRRGTLADYQALARFHYRGGVPARCVRVLVAEPRSTSPVSGHEPVGVLVVAMPTRHGWWRRLAWPGCFDGPDRRQALRRLNASVRTIARVVIEPRWRGVGLARRMVRAYLRRPLTVATEAVAVMGAWCPFLAAAGMTEYRLPQARTLRLSDALAAANIAPAQLLILSPRRLERWLSRRGWLMRELHRWARASRSTQCLVGGPPAALVRAAAGHLLAPPVAYAHTSRHDGREHVRRGDRERDGCKARYG